MENLSRLWTPEFIRDIGVVSRIQSHGASNERDRRLPSRAETQKILSIRLQQTIDSILRFGHGKWELLANTIQRRLEFKVQTSIPEWIGQHHKQRLSIKNALSILKSIVSGPLETLWY